MHVFTKTAAQTRTQLIQMVKAMHERTKRQCKRKGLKIPPGRSFLLVCHWFL
eukprot:COSAG02_NODE_47152_length_343_cov_0.844262_1_plen_51_part_01